MLLHKLDTVIKAPERFTWPFCYEPHPLCILASEHLQAYIASVAEWREEAVKGKMFGVLVVSDGDGGLGYLAAYSGQLCGCNDLPGFVPAIYDILQPDGYFRTHENKINAVNRQLNEMENDCRRLEWLQHLDDIKAEAEHEIDSYRQKMAEAKVRRAEARSDANCDLDALVRESQFMKAELRRKKQAFSARISKVEEHIKDYDIRISELKRRRREMSDALQHWIFSRFVMQNALAEKKDLNEIFACYHAETGTGAAVPPSGAGECCAPKLLQYAYVNGYRPLCMAEFWYGESPKAELRRHLHYYPACQSKCRPILHFMLQGLSVDPDPLESRTTGKELRTVYEDEYIVVVDKPSGMLSVPGNTGRQSVVGMTGLLPVHRLDMDTSGLLLLAKTDESQRIFRRMFESRRIRKRYVALLDGNLKSNSGEVTLPIAPDYSDRPRQKVDYDNGKPAMTYYEVIDRKEGRTLVALYPHTGRTHQLRVHCSHPDGLNIPIVGDRLYGNPAKFLCLCAERLEFWHPMFDKQITILLNDNNEESNSQKTPWSAFLD